MRPPISLAELKDYHDGSSTGEEVFELADGERISRPEILGNPDETVVRKLIAASKSGDASKLHRSPRKSQEACAKPDGDSSVSPTFLGELVPIAFGLAAFFAAFFIGGDELLSDPAAPLVYGAGAGLLGFLTAKQVRRMLVSRTTSKERSQESDSPNTD